MTIDINTTMENIKLIILKKIINHFVLKNFLLLLPLLVLFTATTIFGCSFKNKYPKNLKI
jgi:hypothetical protein